MLPSHLTYVKAQQGDEGDEQTHQEKKLHREAEKRNQFCFVCIFLLSRLYLTETGEFFTYIRPKQSRSISYNSASLILDFAKNFAATVTLNILCLPVK